MHGINNLQFENKTNAFVIFRARLYRTFGRVSTGLQ